LGRELHRITGVDLTRIDGIDVGVAQMRIPAHRERSFRTNVNTPSARW
jgi:hypothetical protein